MLTGGVSFHQAKRLPSQTVTQNARLSKNLADTERNLEGSLSKADKCPMNDSRLSEMVDQLRAELKESHQARDELIQGYAKLKILLTDATRAEQSAHREVETLKVVLGGLEGGLGGLEDEAATLERDAERAQSQLKPASHRPFRRRSHRHL